jgi:hypothetical protein
MRESGLWNSSGILKRSVETLAGPVGILAGDYAPAHYQLALALRRKGDSARAQAEFDKAHQLDPHMRLPFADDKKRTSAARD